MSDEIKTTAQLAKVAAEESTRKPSEVDIPSMPVFGKYATVGITITDPGLIQYIKLHLVGIPHSSARHANRRFAKQKTHVVERLVNVVMRTGTYNGKKGKALQVVEMAFDRIHERTKENPVQVFINAIEKSAPREEVTRLRYGGINVPKSVDVAPQRRLDIALRNLAKGGTEGSYKSTKHVSVVLSDEILKAAKGDQASYAVAKKDEVERVAKSAR